RHHRISTHTRLARNGTRTTILEDMVRETLTALLATYRKGLDKVAILVEDVPTRLTTHASGSKGDPARSLSRDAAEPDSECRAQAHGNQIVRAPESRLLGVVRDHGTRGAPRGR